MNQKENDYATAPVPMSERKGFWQTAAVWIGWCISLSAFLTGGTIAQGCTLWEGLAAVLAGNLLLAVIGIFCGIIGFKTGLTTYTAYRMIFGMKGNVIVSVVMGINLMSFIGVLLDSFANTLHGLMPFIPVPAAIVVFSGCIFISSFNGFKGLSLISMVAAPTLWILLALCLVMTMTKNGGVPTLLAWEPTEKIPFITAMGAAVATWIGGAAKTADLTRYSKKVSHVIGGSLMGYILGSGLFEGVAVICAIGAGSGNIVTVMASMGLLIPASVVLGLALWTTTDNNIYSSALAFSDASEIVGVKIPRKVWVIVCVLMAMGVSLMGLSNNFKNFLSFFGSISGPLAGIMISHFFVLHLGKKEYFIPDNFGAAGFIAWIASFIISQASSTAIPTVTAIILGFIIYTICGFAFDKIWGGKSSGKMFVIGEISED